MADDAPNQRPAPYVECIRRYSAGEHWHAHEVLEDLWRATQDPERRRFYQGIIQLAAAMVHAERGNLRGVQRLLAKAAEKLRPVASPCLGLDVATLLREMERAAAEARAAAAADPPRPFDWRHKPRLDGSDPHLAEPQVHGVHGTASAPPRSQGGRDDRSECDDWPSGAPDRRQGCGP